MQLTLAVCLLALAVVCHGHGYVSQPRSRSFLCYKNGNRNCGPVKWEPWSIEGKSHYPDAGPADGSLASGGNARFSGIDEQSPSRWSKVDIQAGNMQFKWFLTTPHSSRSWRYFITRQGWAGDRLARDSFDSAPFCTRNGHGRLPSEVTVHDCNVPQRSGYHVIMGVWEIADTPNTFYQVIDVQFGGAQPPPRPTPPRRTPQPMPVPVPSPPATGCRSKCFGHDCDHYVKKNYSCSELESQYKCDCSGCRLCSRNPPSMPPAVCVPANCFTYGCDHYVKEGYTCDMLQRRYKCDCSGCQC